jgi:GNAT superfamily N-acetyltransferase
VDGVGLLRVTHEWGGLADNAGMDQPATITYEQTWGPGSIPQHLFTARDGACTIGTLIVNGEKSDWRAGMELRPWTIFNISVRHNYQRRGIARSLLEAAEQRLPAVHHSPYLSEEGAAWAEAMQSRCAF